MDEPETLLWNGALGQLGSALIGGRKEAEPWAEKRSRIETSELTDAPYWISYRGQKPIVAYWNEESGCFDLPGDDEGVKFHEDSGEVIVLAKVEIPDFEK